jgi:hypothetical protein
MRVVSLLCCLLLVLIANFLLSFSLRYRSSGRFRAQTIRILSGKKTVSQKNQPKSRASPTFTLEKSQEIGYKLDGVLEKILPSDACLSFVLNILNQAAEKAEEGVGGLWKIDRHGVIS